MKNLRDALKNKLEEDIAMDWKSMIALIFGTFILLAPGGSRTTSAAPAPQACSLLTQAQVSAAASIALDVGKESGALDCQWSEPGKGAIGKGVLLHVLGPVGSLSPAERFNTIKTPLPMKGIVKTPVSGVGDDAVYITMSGRSELTVKKGDSVFQIKVYGFPDEEAKAKEKTLAQNVLAKL
jgi:hypothetical protein